MGKAAAFSILLVLSACATQPTDNIQTMLSDSSDQNKSLYVCTRERPLGSHMLRRVCRSRAQLEAEEKRGRETLKRSIREQEAILGRADGHLMN